jgi:hypothetical protein
MEAAWRALAEEQDWLDEGSISEYKKAAQVKAAFSAWFDF